MSLNVLFGFMSLAIVAATRGADAYPTKVERMIVSKMRMSDLETSGSGYAYSQQQGLPASYIQYTNHGSRMYYDAPKPVHYISPAAVAAAPAPVAHPIAAIQQRELANVVYPNLKDSPYRYIASKPTLLSEPLASYSLKSIPARYALEKPLEESESSYQRFTQDDEDIDSSEEDRAAYKGDNDEADFRENDSAQDARGPSLLGANKWKAAGSLAPHAGHDVAYVNDAGETYDAAKYSSHGIKGETGYKARNEFDEGERGEHFEDNHKGHYNDEGGHEKARSETEKHYAQHGEEEKGVKGANYGQVKYHKKGHKTTGFHNVYHKDEYKKDTDFYDEEHKSGNFEKYDSADERHWNAEGATKKGHRHDAGYHRQAHANEGNVDKGRHHKHRQGHSNKKADESYHKKEADFSNHGGRNHKKGYGHSERNFD